MGLFTPDWRNLIPGYGVYLVGEAIGHLFSGPPGAEAAEARPQLMPLGAIGWTQVTISPKVYNVTTGTYNPFRDEVQAALNIVDLEQRQQYLKNRFDPLVIFYDEQDGYLSIDNRRLTIFRMTLPPDAMVPVVIVSKEQAGRIIAERGMERSATLEEAETAYAMRYQTQNGGYSINITYPRREGGRQTISQGIQYVQFLSRGEGLRRESGSKRKYISQYAGANSHTICNT